jgi:uridine phosphorylase
MDKSRPILRPKPFKHFPAARVIYIPVDLPSGLIAKHLREKTSRIEISEWGTLIGIPDKTVMFKTMGAPLAVMTLERLLAGGAGEILVLGFCGALTPRLRIGTAVSTVKAYSDEGTSRHYAPGKKIFKPGAVFQKAIEDALRSRRLPFVTAKAVSTDAPFRETPEWLMSMRRKGCEVADMETSAVFALAAHYRRPAASLMLVSDELDDGTWRNGFFDSGLNDEVRRYFLPFL